MSETPLNTPDSEDQPKVLELVRLGQAPHKKNSVLYVPPIMASTPGSDVVDQFTRSENDFWFVNMFKYGHPDPDIQLRELQREIADKMSETPSNDLRLIGFSASCVVVARLAEALDLPKEYVFLVAPVYPNSEEFNKIRTKSIRLMLQARLRSILSGDFIDSPERLEEQTGSYALKFLKGGSFLWGERNSLIPGVEKIRELRAWNEEAKRSQIYPKRLGSGIVLSGGKDHAVSPIHYAHTDILVPEASHNFKAFVPTIVKTISAGRSPQ